MVSAHDVATARGAKSVTANDIMNAIDVIEFGPPQDLRPIMEKELAGKCPTADFCLPYGPEHAFGI